MLIGICGKAGSGKDTIADYLVTEYGFQKIALADPIKRLIKDVFVLDDYTVYDRIAREQPLDKWNGWSVRKLLQVIATELFRNNIDRSIWVKSLYYRISSNPEINYIVSDIRFPNELKYLSENCSKFLSIKVVRQGYNGNVGVEGHESESYDLDTDYIVTNDKNISDLYVKIDEIIKDRI